MSTLKTCSASSRCAKSAALYPVPVPISHTEQWSWTSSASSIRAMSPGADEDEVGPDAPFGNVPSRVTSGTSEHTRPHHRCGSESALTSRHSAPCCS